MTTPISKQTLLSFLFDQGYDDVRATDDFYALPSCSWLEGKFSKALAREQHRRGMDRYRKTKNNCTKFTRAAATYAAELHAHTPAGANEEAALAFGAFDFIRPGGGRAHSLNIAVCRDPDGMLRAVFYEPQTRTIVPTPLILEGTHPAVLF